MKRRELLLFMLALVAALACSNDDELSRSVKTSVLSDISVMGIRSVDDAIMIAQSVFSREQTRLALNNIEVDDVVIVRNDLSDGLQVNSDTLFYVVNYRNNKGFAIISANPNVEALLAVVERGHFSSESETGVAGFDNFVKLAKQYLLSNKNSDRAQHPHAHIDTLITSSGPFLPVTWGQSNYAGHYCPYGVCGCGPLAAAQVLSYYKYPTSIELTYSGADMTTQSLNWNDIRQHQLYYEVDGYEDPTYCTASDSAHNSIGRLCRQLGELSVSIYDNDSTVGTTMFFLQNAMQLLGMSCDSIRYYSNQCTRASLARNRLIIMCGEHSNDADSIPGHIWVVDGFYHKKIVIADTVYYATGLNTPEYELVFTEFNEYYNHINWGWEGMFNGYFLDNVFMVSSNSAMLDSSPYSPYNVPDDYSDRTRYFVVYKKQTHG